MNRAGRYVLRTIAAKLLDWSDDSATHLESSDSPNGVSHDLEGYHGGQADFERADKATSKRPSVSEQVARKERSKTIRAQLATPRSLRSAWVAREILGPPKALRTRSRVRMQ